MRKCPLTLILIVLNSALLFADDWPQFRGPQGDGHCQARNLPTSWGGPFEPPRWQTMIPGRGWSSPIVVGERIWLTSAEPTSLPAQRLKEKLAKNPYGDADFQTHASITLFAVELDAKDGKILQQIELFTSDDPAPIHASNSYASPTPTSDGERLYCHFGGMGTVCLEQQSGRVLWKRQFPVDDITGPGSSPVLWGDRLILSCDGADQQFLVALDKLTGEEVWRTLRPPIAVADGKLRRAFSTPLVIGHNGRTQVISPGANWAVSYDPDTGNEWWRAKVGTGHALVPRPVYRSGFAYVCSGYPKPKIVALRVDGSGDVSDTHVVWTYDKQVPEISSPVLAGDHIYFVSLMGIASCLDARTGELVWRHRMEGNYAASPLAADGRLFFTNQAGVTTVLAPGPEYDEVSKNPLFGQTMASLAIAGESLLIRTDPMLYCIRRSTK